MTYCDTHGNDGVTMVKIKYKAFVKFSMGVQVTSVISLKNSFSIKWKQTAKAIQTKYYSENGSHLN